MIAATRSNFVEIIDVSDPSFPRSAGRFPNEGRALGIDRRGNIAAVALASVGVDLLDITDPRAPVRLSTTKIGVSARDVVMAEGRVYAISSSYQDIYPIDIRDPANPVVYPAHRLPAPLSAVQSVPRNPESFVVQGSMIFCSTSDGTIRILDASDPGSIVEVGTFAPGAWISGVEDDYLFASGPGSGHFVLDLSKPESPIWGSRFSSSHGGRVMGDLLISGLDYRITVFDISTPMQVVPVGSLFARYPDGYFGPPLSTAQAVLADEHLFAIEAGLRLVIYSVRPNLPVIVNELPDQAISVSEDSEIEFTPLTVHVSGAAPVAYQWYYGESGDTKEPILGETSRSLSKSEILLQGGATQKYWVRITNPVGSVDSRTVTISRRPRLGIREGRLRISGPSSTTWIVQASVDLSGWATLGRVTLSSSEGTVGNAEFSIDPPAPPDVGRFYRAVEKVGD